MATKSVSKLNTIISTPEDVYNLMQNEKMTLQDKVSFTHPKKTHNRAINMSLGRIWFNILLPDDYELIDEPVNKAKMNQIIVDLYKKYGVEKTAEIITRIQSEAFKLATIYPSTFNIQAFIPPKSWIHKKEQFLKKAASLSPIEFKKEAEEITKELIQYIKENDFELQNIFESGAKGNPVADWEILMLAKGYVIDIEGNLLGPITNSINDGYDKINYYNAAAEARRNFFFRSNLTANPGYLATKVVMANAGIRISDEVDCKTKRYFEINVTPEIIKLIQQRYYMDDKLKKITDDSLVNKTIKLRSPLYCKSEDGICQICYGDLWKILNTRNIGILAGGAINVVGVNALMKLRHQASSVSLKPVNFIEIIRKFGMDVEKLSNLFEIEKNRIAPKEKCTIVIDLNEYDDTLLIDCGDKFQMPGIVNVQFGQGDDNLIVTLPIAITVDIMKPSDYTEEDNIITLTYEPGETIMKQDYYSDLYDERIVIKLFEAGAKYINNPEVLVNSIKDKLPGIDLVHLEVIISNMFRDADDNSKPARLTNYKNFEIISQKRLPFINSWLNALAFENVNKAIKVGLIEGKEAELDPIERIIIENYRFE